jgi:hypothetical protein
MLCYALYVIYNSIYLLFVASNTENVPAGDKTQVVQSGKFNSFAQFLSYFNGQMLNQQVVHVEFANINKK